MNKIAFAAASLLLSAGIAAAQTDGIRLNEAQNQELRMVEKDETTMTIRIKIEKVSRAETTASPFPSWLDVKSLKAVSGAAGPGTGGSHIIVTLKDAGNNTVSLRKPSPAPPRIDRTLYVTFSPFLMVHPVTEGTINGSNAAAYKKLFKDVQSQEGFESLPEGVKGAVKAFESQLAIRFPERQSSGRTATAEQIRAFLKTHEAKILAVPGVLNASVGFGFGGTGMPFLVVTVKSSHDLDQVRKAVMASVPEISRFNGVMGTPTQLDFKHPGRND